MCNVCNGEKARLGLVGLGDHMYRRLYLLTVGLPVTLAAVCETLVKNCIQVDFPGGGN